MSPTPYLPVNPSHTECAHFLAGVVDGAIPDHFMTFILVTDRRSMRTAQMGNLNQRERIALLEDALEQARRAHE